MTQRKLPYPADAPRHPNGWPMFDSNGRPTPLTSYRLAASRKGGKSFRMRKRDQEREAFKARVAAEAATLRTQLQTAFQPPPGKLFGVEEAAMMIIGPNGGIGTTALLVRTMAQLAAKGRHAPESLLVAGWQDLDHLSAGMDAFAGKLGAVGLMLDRRKTGWRITKAKIVDLQEGQSCG